MVDDEPEIMRTLAWQLEDMADVVTSSSVGGALELLGEQRFDVVVADLRLPSRWGDELLAHVAARSPETRRFLLTGDGDPQRTVRELLDMGVIHACYQKRRAQGLLDAIRGLQPADRAASVS
jgi:DNA-binding NtrC family response regulator